MSRLNLRGNVINEDTIEELVQLNLDGHNHPTIKGEVEDFNVQISFSDGQFHDITNWLYDNDQATYNRLVETFKRGV
jgi:hypothetical protein